MSNENEPRWNVNWMFIGNNTRELTAIIYERRIFAELKLIISQNSNFDALCRDAQKWFLFFDEIKIVFLIEI